MGDVINVFGLKLLSNVDLRSIWTRYLYSMIWIYFQPSLRAMSDNTSVILLESCAPSHLLEIQEKGRSPSVYLIG